MDESRLITSRLADRLRHLRLGRNWSLDQLAQESGVSRASLSRLEQGAVSPTTETLARLCSAYGLTLTRLMAQVEEPGFTAHIRKDAQSIWQDASTGFVRRSISPPATALRGEVIEASLEPKARIAYASAPIRGQEHHLILLSGALTLTLDGVSHFLTAGDCLRYRLDGPNTFEAGSNGARYILVLIAP